MVFSQFVPRGFQVCFPVFGHPTGNRRFSSLQCFADFALISASETMQNDPGACLVALRLVLRSGRISITSNWNCFWCRILYSPCLPFINVEILGVFNQFFFTWKMLSLIPNVSNPSINFFLHNKKNAYFGKIAGLSLNFFMSFLHLKVNFFWTTLIMIRDQTYHSFPSP